MSFFTCLFSIIHRSKIHLFCTLFICSCNHVAAQLWNGNLGAAVLNVTFGAGPSEPLPGDATSFTYTKGCPLAGQYSIEHQLPGCFDDTAYVIQPQPYPYL
jgi:hypothetical protein